MDKRKKEQLKKALQQALKPMNERLAGIPESLKKAGEVFGQFLEGVEVEYQEAAEFYRDWAGKKPPKFSWFLDYYFGVKNADKTAREIAAREAVRPEDIQAAGEWLTEQLKYRWIREAVRKAAKEHPIHQPGQIAAETRLLVENAALYENRLKTGIYTREEVLADIQKYLKQFKENYLKNSDSNPNPKHRNGALGSLAAIYVLQELEARYSPGTGHTSRNTGTSKAPKGPRNTGARGAGVVDFESLFKSDKYPALIVQAMQEAEPGPLLNEEGKPVLSGKGKVAPLVALVDAIFYRKLTREGITTGAIYSALCQHFGFKPSSRPDKARREGEGVYQDYWEAFNFFLLNNRPE